MEFVFDNTTPIYLQLVEQLKIYIISGKVKPGERLMSVREMATKCKVNPNTMQKALVELENMGLVKTERTSGRFVTTDEELVFKFKKEYAKAMAENYFASMERIGFSKEETINYLKELGGQE